MCRVKILAIDLSAIHVKSTKTYIGFKLYSVNAISSAGPVSPSQTTESRDSRAGTRRPAWLCLTTSMETVRGGRNHRRGRNRNKGGTGTVVVVESGY